MKLLSQIIVLTVFGVLPCAVLAQDAAPKTEITHKKKTSTLDDVTDPPLQVEVHKGKRITLPGTAISVVAANPDIADVQVVSPRVLYVYGKAIGETSVFAVDADENTIYDSTVIVTHDISGLEREVKRVVPEASVTFKTVDGGLVMEGNANTVAEAENIRKIAESYLTTDELNNQTHNKTAQKVINMIKTAGSDQVMLKVKFVEMSRTDLKKLGINLQNVTNRGNFSLQLLQGNTLKYFPLAASSSTTDLVNAPFSVLDRGTSTDTNFMLRYKDLTGLVDALETQGLATVLAEPTLATTSGQAASFLAGGQFPLPVVQSSSGGSPTVTIQYEPFGVSLKFTPIVMAHDHISLTVNPEVSSLDFNNPVQVSGVTYPLLQVRQASAVVELGSGDSFMLAGLMQSEVTNTVNKFPGLGDIPILGALFRSTSFQNNQTDLVIIVTPYIVHPVADASKLQTPLDGYKPPSDLQLLMEGNLYQQQPMDAHPAQPTAQSAEPTSTTIAPMPKLNGGGGFIME
jgi:pilus assembly protein CpaC